MLNGVKSLTVNESTSLSAATVDAPKISYDDGDAVATSANQAMQALVYNRAISDAEILSIYNYGNGTIKVQ